MSDGRAGKESININASTYIIIFYTLYKFMCK